MPNNNEIQLLIGKSRHLETTLEEETTLLEWLHADPQKMAVLASSCDVESLIKKWAEYENLNTEKAEEKLWAQWQGEKRL
jgi:hypothetical protein